MTSTAKGSWLPDLHAHSTASDGKLSPADLVKRAAGRGVNLLALTDHDSLAGIPEALATARQMGICLIPGVELGCDGSDEVHILAYFVRDDMKRLNRLLRQMRQDREERRDKFLARLSGLGMPLDPEEIPTPPGSAFSRLHLARAMESKGYVTGIGEAFDRYISPGRPAYVPRLFISVEEAVGMLKSEGAVPVLAHPGLLKPGLADSLPAWVEAGLMGIEAYHYRHNKQEQAYWDKLARSKGLLVTGGSDFHSLRDTSHGDLGSMVSAWHSRQQDSEALLSHERLLETAKG